ncbi:MAG: hypothetical protein HY226_03355 [Candidatus Vogelbacteria bacterium]|nr:hypothetical protein [Candidatus Vogelbacteria bacterium]
MNLSWTRSIFKQVAIFTFSALFVVALFGIFSGMQTGMDGKMSNNCPFTIGSSLCSMGVLEHIESWQVMFSSVPKSFGLFILLAAILAVFFLTFYSILPNTKNTLLFIIERRRSRFYTPFSQPILQEAFSQGILNTKVY